MSNQEVVPVWTLADRLVKARQYKGVDQAAIAKELGVSQRAISKFEHGAPVREAFVKVWSMFCGVDYDWLRYGTAPGLGPDDAGGPDDRRLRCNFQSPGMSDFGLFVERRTPKWDRRRPVLVAA